MLLGSVRNRAPSLHRGGRHRTHRPRRASGDAPARGTRRGSPDGMAPRRHLTVLTDRARSLKPGAGRTRPGSKRVAGGRTRWRAPGNAPRKRHTVQEILPRRATVAGGERGQRRQPRAEEDSRLAACPRVEHALQRSVVQSWPREAVGFFPPLLERHGSSRRGAGARSRVNIPDGHRKIPVRALETTRRPFAGPLRGRSRRLRVARPEMGSTKRSVARASY